MKTFTNKKGKEYLLVEAPEDSFDFKMQFSVLENELILTYKTPHRWDNYRKENWNWNVKGNYQIIGLAKDVSEEVAAKICDQLWQGYLNYILKDGNVGNYKRLVLKTATESLSSLIKLLCLSSNVLILEKIIT